MSLSITPKQARLWALVLLGTVVTLAGVLRSDAVLLAAGATFLGVPALMAGGTPNVERSGIASGAGAGADEPSVGVAETEGSVEEVAGPLDGMTDEDDF